MPNDSPYGGFTSERIKHLEMIQSVITRLGGNGFVVKGWGVTVAGALLGLAVNKSDAGLAYVTLVPIVAFWLLDGYLLWSERCFRALFEMVRASDAAVVPFAMAATGTTFRRSADAAGHRVHSWPVTMLRPTLLVFYAGLGIAALVVGVLVD
jgi:hypothetical protein